ncbi:S16 family serine protease [Glutamicibacter sp.]|uniref:YlbL family protein n=1 Tax=Glutamicibacter sp. TaxID=1931995 RepID=UPI0028BD5C95|nr:S16 family serine protease [Glutamicibacter sp.]
MHEQEPIISASSPVDSGGASIGSARAKRTNAGIIALLLIGIMMFLPTNFVIRSPGPVLNTLGEVDGTKLITIDGAKSYESESVLDMLTVYVQGGGNNRVTVPVVLEALFNPTKDIAPEETVIPRGVTSDQQSEQNDFQMVSSQDQAVAAALTELGYDYKTWLDVAGFATDTNKDVLKNGDRLLKFEGKDIESLEQLKAELDKQGDKASTLTIGRPDRNGKFKTMDVQVSTTPGEGGHRQLGVLLNTSHDFPIDVKFGVENIGGPSAGMMFSLAIIDRLTEGSIAGDHQVAGTGTIDQQGKVGAIGGIAQKMVAAQRSGATIFLAPADNCSDVVGRVPEGLNVIKVSTLKEARQALEDIANGANPARMTTCK